MNKTKTLALIVLGVWLLTYGLFDYLGFIGSQFYRMYYPRGYELPLAISILSGILFLITGLNVLRGLIKLVLGVFHLVVSAPIYVLQIAPAVAIKPIFLAICAFEITWPLVPLSMAHFILPMNSPFIVGTFGALCIVVIVFFSKRYIQFISQTWKVGTRWLEQIDKLGVAQIKQDVDSFYKRLYERVDSIWGEQAKI